jgi:hypothetical protein
VSRAYRCEVCDDTPNWRLDRQGDAVVTWACHRDLHVVLLRLQRQFEADNRARGIGRGTEVLVTQFRGVDADALTLRDAVVDQPTPVSPPAEDPAATRAGPDQPVDADTRVGDGTLLRRGVKRHVCRPPGVGVARTFPLAPLRIYPVGSVWRCDCGLVWVQEASTTLLDRCLRRPVNLDWRHETRREARRRLKTDVGDDDT